MHYQLKAVLTNQPHYIDYFSPFSKENLEFPYDFSKILTILINKKGSHYVAEKKNFKGGVLVFEMQKKSW